MRIAATSGALLLSMLFASGCALKATGTGPAYQLAAGPEPDNEPVQIENTVTATPASAETATPIATATPEPPPSVQLTAPSASWIEVPVRNAPDPETLAMFLHPRGDGRLTVRKVRSRNSVDATLTWLKSRTRGLEVHERGESSRGVKREEFTFQAWEGRRAIAGRAGVYVIDGEGYAVVAQCNKNVFDRYRKDFDRVLAEFRKAE